MKKLSHLSMLWLPLALTSYAPAQQQKQPAGQGDQDQLVQIVRNATSSTRMRPAAGYRPALGCVSGSDHGAMGVHYVNGQCQRRNSDQQWTTRPHETASPDL